MESVARLRNKGEGCQNCYMYFLDRVRDKSGSDIYKTKSGFDYPLQKDRYGNYARRAAAIRM